MSMRGRPLCCCPTLLLMMPVPQLQPMHLRSSSISAVRGLVCAHRTFITASGLVSPLR